MNCFKVTSLAVPGTLYPNPDWRAILREVMAVADMCRVARGAKEAVVFQ
jgi:hypothetical protein